MPESLPLGMLVAVVDLVDVRPTETLANNVSAEERQYGNYEPGRYGWIFDNIRVIHKPVEYKGGQGFFYVPDSLVYVALGLPTSQAEACQLVGEVWESKPETLALLQQSIQFVQQNLDSGGPLQLSRMQEAFSCDAMPLLKSLRFLSGATLPLLDMRFQYSEAGPNLPAIEHYEYSVADVAKFQLDKLFSNPRTGKPVPDFETKLYAMFRPTAYAKWLLQPK